MQADAGRECIGGVVRVANSLGLVAFRQDQRAAAVLQQFGEGVAHASLAGRLLGAST